MELLEALIRIVVGLAGVALVARTMLAALRSLLLPRGANDRVSRFLFLVVRRTFGWVAGPERPYAFRDRILAYYGPVSLLLVLIFWLFLVMLGYALIYWAIGVGSDPARVTDVSPIVEALRLSGSSLLTLGFAAPSVPGTTFLVFSEATLGLILVAMLIAYLPTIYGAFSRRELLVNLLEVRADSPPSAVVMLTRFQRLHGLDSLHAMWEQWEPWFSELEETHTSLPILVFYRSQQANHSWVNAAGAIMDTAALARSVVDMPLDVQADLTIRAGYLAVRRIADYFNVAYDHSPRQDDPTSISRAQFEAACAVLEAAGVPLKVDRNRAWLDFNGWRVNYDAPLRALERIALAPPSWWERPMASAYVTDEPVVGGAGTGAAEA
ncbi:MAG TPA: hypothetical protein VK592_02055 [Candidatus Dormibacteraeota bacterium]|nr:hypothetical protein [Candidatus Dormibacteraeota bacterium]